MHIGHVYGRLVSCYQSVMFAAGRYVCNYVDEKSEELGLSPDLELRPKYRCVYFILDSAEDGGNKVLRNTGNYHKINPLNAELNPICHLLALLVHFLHVSRIRVKSLTLRLLMSYIYIYIYI